RNIQLVVREEAFMKYVLDPAGGSYFIDTLTEELVQKSWSLFQTIQEKGGYDQYQASGELDKRIEQSRHTRFNDVYAGKRILVGTNKYADPNEEGGLSTSVDFDGRLARPFEELRSHLQTSAPQTVLLRFGTLATCKARTDFV